MNLIQPESLLQFTTVLFKTHTLGKIFNRAKFLLINLSKYQFWTILNCPKSDFEGLGLPERREVPPNAEVFPARAPAPGSRIYVDVYVRMYEVTGRFNGG